jgi:hypothetical protein
MSGIASVESPAKFWPRDAARTCNRDGFATLGIISVRIVAKLFGQPVQKATFDFVFQRLEGAIDALRRWQTV